MALEATNIGYAYPGCTPVFEQISLTVASRERLALTAPSGFGKTTLCRVLAGYMPPLTGRILVDGSSLPKRGVRPVQLLWQHPEQAFAPHLRLRNSLAEAGAWDGQTGRELRERFGVRGEWLDRMPHELSGGELMRSCMVRALLAHPRYLIADEATAMLDALTQMEVWKAFISVLEAEEMGLLFVSHSPSLVSRIATRSIDLASLCRQSSSLSS
ncbi:ATP-binding cassette domain-containing protein [Collinsella sp. AGMB00827]|uniref:ATP-binding cassette domain-containing protein n=1 Tax=Collinsella ureilytica TaxID=2869515 RepID=A0ABS7MHY5_9ACTN|nr:ATP-binding cassette domain-containing protein [Collinsella urealyticum]MBY4796852.1 ATP-binding cassette domain-containing protein [Collinsella urealyticum]